jgi:hypothetical protein
MEMATTRKSRRLSSRWSQERELAFLEHLALSSNVAASERVAKLTPGTAYRQRRKEPAFARAWDAALREGYLFDVPVRFAEDTLEVSRSTFLAGEAPSVPLIEVREP